MYEGCSEERVAVLCMSRDNRLLYHGFIQEGDVSSASFHMKKLTEVAIKTNANHIILAHNHPGGSELPSSEDLTATRHMAASLATNGIELREHYIVHDGKLTSILEVLGYNLKEKLYW